MKKLIVLAVVAVSTMASAAFAGVSYADCPYYKNMTQNGKQSITDTKTAYYPPSQTSAAGSESSSERVGAQK